MSNIWATFVRKFVTKTFQKVPIWSHFFKWAIPGFFLFLFLFFSNKNYNFTTNICDKRPSSIQCWDLNPRPSEHESPPLTTRPGLPLVTLFVPFGHAKVLPRCNAGQVRVQPIHDRGRKPPKRLSPSRRGNLPPMSRHRRRSQLPSVSNFERDSKPRPRWNPGRRESTLSESLRKGNNVFIWNYYILGNWQRKKICDQSSSLVERAVTFFKKMGNPGLSYRLFLVFSNKLHYNFYSKYMWKNVYPVYSAWIQTHDLWNMSLLP